MMLCCVLYLLRSCLEDGKCIDTMNDCCVTFQATETFLVNEDPSRGPGMPECFVVSDSYRVCIIIVIIMII